MKLKNKKTGEIRELPDGFFCGDNLQKICEEWEDYYEGPKKYWYMENNGEIYKDTYDDDGYEERMIEIGNYFSSREEAELAVCKLKAWKRLKDRKFDFYGYQFHDILSGVLNIKAEFENDSDNQIIEDLDLLFSGGEE